MGTSWIIEGSVDDRWPINTRGNVGEVFPEVLTPLSYRLGVIAAEKAWRDAYAELGVAVKGDFAGDDPVIIGLYGGYAYLNLSYLRILGVRAPGSSPEAIDVAFFGEGDPPPYEPRKGDRSLRSTLRILKSVTGALGTKAMPSMVAESYALADAHREACPPLDASDEDLLAYLHAFPAAFGPAFKNHMLSSALASIVAGFLADACAAAGEPGLVTHLLGSAGDVKSAEYARDLYAIARTVQNQPTVAAAFDAGVAGLLQRLDSSRTGDSDVADFLGRFADFVADHGHRGPNDWELSSRNWENTPEMALVAIDRMRLADHDLDPAARLADDGERRDAAIAVVRPHVKGLDRKNFDKALAATAWWAQAREATRDRAIHIGAPTKQVYRELVRRAAKRGGDSNPVRVALLDPIDELPSYLADPGAFTDLLAERGALFDRYAAVEPRFFITSQDEVPTIEELEADQAARAADTIAAPGDVLTGASGCQGVARGRARIVMDPADALDLEPGEVLVAPITDPAWTPLFLPSAAVVVDVGALMSHAVIVSRELGIPCVVSVEGATRRIPDGALVEVDGTAGTVTVLDD
ncbi:MAG: phosphoenolpyruvate-utilizing protein [Acidimicrobiaceae bacterium]|nr:phosphoenolpyruvate-utilizing protein [Acidimicrobiaceae bacterium]